MDGPATTPRSAGRGRALRGLRPRRSRRHALLAGLTALVLAGTGSVLVAGQHGSSRPPAAATTSTAPAVAPGRPAGLLVPAHGVLLGSYSPGTTGSGQDRLAALEQDLGRRVSVDQRYYAWDQPFPTSRDRQDLASGRVPLISWAGTNLMDIVSGRYDDLITTRAHALAALGKPVFLRWDWEMNATWNPAGGPRSNSPGQHDGPAAYVAAWHHIRELFRQAGVTNVAFVWCPNWVSKPAAGWNDPQRYYPGDADVDWVGVDAYNFGTSQPGAHWESLADLVKPVYKRYAPHKPIMIAELSTTGSGGSRSGWIEQATRDLRRMPAVAALVWFDRVKERDWSLRTDDGSLQAFRRLAEDPYVGDPTS